MGPKLTVGINSVGEVVLSSFNEGQPLVTLMLNVDWARWVAKELTAAVERLERVELPERRERREPLGPPIAPPSPAVSSAASPEASPAASPEASPAAPSVPVTAASSAASPATAASPVNSPPVSLRDAWLNALQREAAFKLLWEACCWSHSGDHPMRKELQAVEETRLFQEVETAWQAYDAEWQAYEASTPKPSAPSGIPGAGENNASHSQ